MSSATPYCKCVICNRNKTIYSDKYPGGMMEIPPFDGDPSEAPFLLFVVPHAGPGRGRREKVGCWEKVQEVSLGEALEDPEFAGLAMQYRARLISLVRF